jgi:hypothetical protein
MDTAKAVNTDKRRIASQARDGAEGRQLVGICRRVRSAVFAVLPAFEDAELAPPPFARSSLDRFAGHVGLLFHGTVLECGLRGHSTKTYY